MIETLIPKVPYAPISYGGQEVSTNVLHSEIFIHPQNRHRILTVVTKTWHGDAYQLTEDGERQPPTEVETEIHLDPTPMYVVKELRKVGVEFGAYSSTIGTNAQIPDISREYFSVFGDRTEEITAHVVGFTPMQLAIINAHVDARP